MQYRRTPTSSGYSPSELLNSRQIRTRIDTLLPSPAHRAQGLQAKMATRSQLQESVSKLSRTFNVGDPVYALYYGPRRDREPRWVPAIVIKRLGSRSVNVKVLPRGPTWRRHLEQLQPRHSSAEDEDPGEYTDDALSPMMITDHPMELPATTSTRPKSKPKTIQPPDVEYGRNNPRRSKRKAKPPERLCYKVERLNGCPSGSPGRCCGRQPASRRFQKA